MACCVGIVAHTAGAVITRCSDLAENQTLGHKELEMLLLSPLFVGRNTQVKAGSVGVHIVEQ